MVVSLGAFPDLPLTVGGVRIDAGVHSAVGNAVVGLLLWFGWLPHLYADDPLPVQELDVRFVDQALGQCVPRLDGTEARDLDTTLAVVLDLGDARGGAEGNGAGVALLVENGAGRLYGQCRASFLWRCRVHEGAFGDAAGHGGGEWVILVLAGVENFVEILPGRPGHSVSAAEPVGGDAEVVDKSVDANGSPAVALLTDREVNGY